MLERAKEKEIKFNPDIIAVSDYKQVQIQRVLNNAYEQLPEYYKNKVDSLEYTLDIARDNGFIFAILSDKEGVIIE